MPKTLFSSNLEEINKFIKTNKKIVIKPINGFGGNNIYLIKNKINKIKLKKIIHKKTVM